MKKSLTVILISLFWILQSNAQENLKNVISGDDIRVSSDEFKLRYELTPHPAESRFNTEEQDKVTFAYTLLAEKLLARYAEDQKLDSLETVKATLKAFEKMYVRDLVFQNEINSKVNLSAKDLTEGFERAKKILNVKFIFSKSEKEIKKLKSEITISSDFDSLFSLRPESKEQTSLISVTFGTMQKNIEDELYKLKNGETGKPLKMNEGWYLFKLEFVEPMNITGNDSESKIKSNVKKIVRSRETEKYYVPFLDKFMKDKKTDIKGILYSDFNKSILKMIEKNKDRENEKNHLIEINADDIDSYRKSLSEETLDSPFLKFKTSPLTYREFLNDFSFEGFSVKKSDEKHYSNQLYNHVKTMIRNEFISREGYRRKYDQNPEIKMKMKMWHDNLLADLIKGRTFSGIESEVISLSDTSITHSDLSIDSFAVKIKIRSFENSQDIIQASMKLNEGILFSNLNGTLEEFGNKFILPSDLGNIGITALSLKNGETSGPVTFKGKHALVFLEDKKRIFKDDALEKESAVEKRINYQQKRYSNIMNGKIKELAIRYKASVDFTELSKINVSNINMITYQKMGFGGQILAVPYTGTLSGWAKDWELAKRQTP